jgi:HPt (histidine-containing phosphotransfer) domain-containing protein
MIDQTKNNKPLDLSYLQEMAGDSPEFLIEMLDTFVEQIPNYMDDLEKAINNQYWKAASDYAHKLKPTFYYVGREDVRDHVQLIEVNAREQINLEVLQKSFEELKEFLPSLFKQISDKKSQLLAG